jgi:hypothetical protein
MQSKEDEWHALPPEEKAKRMKAFGFGTQPEKVEEKETYKIVHNASVTPDTLYARGSPEQRPFIYFPVSHKLLTIKDDEREKSYTHEKLVFKKSSQTFSYLKGSELIQEMRLGRVSKKKLADIGENQFSEYASYIHDAMYSTESGDLGMINGRYLNGLMSIWVYASDKEIDEMIKLYEDQTGETVEKIYVQSQGLGQNSSTSARQLDGEEVSSASLFDDEKEEKSSIPTEKTNDVWNFNEKERMHWINPEGQDEGWRQEAERDSKGGKKGWPMEAGKKGYVRVEFDAIYASKTKKKNPRIFIQFFSNYVTPEALETTIELIKDYSGVQDFRIDYADIPLKSGESVKQLIMHRFEALRELKSMIENRKSALMVAGDIDEYDSLAEEFVHTMVRNIF